MSWDVLVTTPLFYSSGDPHIGHAYTLIISDLIKKYYALIGKKVYLLTGVDEHGEKISKKAQEEGLTPRELVDKNSKKFRKLWELLSLNPDIFVRTSNEEHKSYVRELFNSLLDSENIYLSHWAGYKCISCETNYSEEYYSRNNCCELGHPLLKKEEESYFLKISNYSVWLEKHYLENQIISPDHYLKNLKSSFLSKPEDLSITRKNLDWGIELKNSPDFKIYVWFEALICYFSNPILRKLWNSPSTKIIQLVGKEIFRFHSIYLPIILKLQGLRLPNRLMVHGWLLNNNRKISKSEMKQNPMPSLGEILQNCNLESVKFYFAFLNWDDDHSFSELLIKQHFNKYIVNLFGNLINRLKGILAKAGGVTSKLDSEFRDQAIKDAFNESVSLLTTIQQKIEDCRIPAVVLDVVGLLEKANSLIEKNEPWKLSVDSAIYKELNVFLYRQLIISAILLSPIFSEEKWIEIKKSLNFSNQIEKFELNFLNSIKHFEGVALPAHPSLFQRYS